MSGEKKHSRNQNSCAILHIKNKPSIYEFLDFRAYLDNCFNCFSEIDSKFTKSSICKQLGLPNSRSYFNDILNGKKRLSEVKMKLFITIFELSKDEAEYFRFLVQYNQTMVLSEKDFFLHKLLSLSKVPKKVVDPQLYAAYYQKWYYGAVRALIDIVDMSDNYDMLASLLIPSITPKQVKNAISLLFNLGMISKNDKGYWKLSDKNISIQMNSQETLIRQYYSEIMDLTKNMIVSGTSSKPNLFLSKTVSVSNDASMKINDLMRAFQTEISSIISNDKKKAEKVCQINLHLFSISNNFNG